MFTAIHKHYTLDDWKLFAANHPKCLQVGLRPGYQLQCLQGEEDLQDCLKDLNWQIGSPEGPRERQKWSLVLHHFHGFAKETYSVSYLENTRIYPLGISVFVPSKVNCYVMTAWRRPVISCQGASSVNIPLAVEKTFNSNKLFWS